MHKILIPVVGQTFNQLTVLEEYDVRDKRLIHMCKCQCSCGKIVDLPKDKVISGHTQSCGCRKREASKKNLTDYNKKQKGKPSSHCKTRNEQRFRYIWRKTKNKCCEEWLTYEVFYKDMFESYEQHVAEFGEAQTGLHLLEGQDVFAKGTCSWMTRTEIAKFRKDAVLFELNGKKLSISELEEMFGIHNRRFIYSIITKHKDNALELLNKYKTMNDICDLEEFAYEIDMKSKVVVDLVLKGFSFEEIKKRRDLTYENVYLEEIGMTLEDAAKHYNIPTYKLRERLLGGIPVERAIALKAKDSYDIYDYREDLFFSLWKSMRARCKRGYKQGMSEEWLDYYAFKKDMYDEYLAFYETARKSDISIDRIDNKGKYEKGNVRFADTKMQMNNTDKTIKVNGISLAEFLEKNDIPINKHSLQAVRKMVEQRELEKIDDFKIRFNKCWYMNEEMTLLDFSRLINRNVSSVLKLYKKGMFPEEIEWHLDREHNTK